MAIGLIPEGLANLAVKVSWTPGEAKYSLTLYRDVKVIEGQEYHAVRREEPFGYDPEPYEFNSAVYHGLTNVMPFPARFAQAIAGLIYFEWISPAAMSGNDREKYGAAK
jgi:hypothetical protein